MSNCLKYFCIKANTSMMKKGKNVYLFLKHEKGDLSKVVL